MIVLIVRHRQRQAGKYSRDPLFKEAGAECELVEAERFSCRSQGDGKEEALSSIATT
jgi:hypothetical protein